MALIKWGMIVVDGRGKLGGQVFSKNRAGAIIRTKVTPANPQTTEQMNSRQLLATYSEKWRTLTQVERNAWNSAVDDFKKTNVFGDLKSPTGKNLYTALNINLSLVGGVELSNPPSPTAVPDSSVTITSLDFDAATDTFSLILDGLNQSTANVALVYATEPLSPGISYMKGRFRLVDSDNHPAQPLNLSTIYASRFGVPALGKKIAFRVELVNFLTGERGLPSQAVGIVTDAP